MWKEFPNRFNGLPYVQVFHVDFLARTRTRKEKRRADYFSVSNFGGVFFFLMWKRWIYGKALMGKEKSFHVSFHVSWLMWINGRGGVR